MNNKNEQKRRIRGLNSDLNQNFNIRKMKNMIALEKYYELLEADKRTAGNPVSETDEYASTDKVETREQSVDKSDFSKLNEFVGAGSVWIFLILVVSYFLTSYFQ